MIVIILPTNKCNGSCKYCHAFKSNDTMDFDTFQNAIDFTNTLYDFTNSLGHLEFHAAEPTTLPISWYEQAEDILNEKGFILPRVLCTNLLNIDNDWIDFLKKYHYRISFSLDGPMNIHDYNRGTGTFRRVIQNFKLLRENNLRGGSIAVLSKYSAENAEQIFPFFNYIKQSFKLNLQIPCDFQKVAADAFIKVFDDWSNSKKQITIKPFPDMINFLLGKKVTRPCALKCNKNLFAIAVNGDVYPCERFYSNEIHKEDYILGNVNTNSFDEIFFGMRRKNFLKDTESLSDECQHCKYYFYCGSGCMYDYTNLKCKSKRFGCSSCYVTKKIFEHMEEKISDEF